MVDVGVKVEVGRKEDGVEKTLDWAGALGVPNNEGEVPRPEKVEPPRPGVVVAGSVKCS